jgi:hypothetical protein
MKNKEIYHRRLPHIQPIGGTFFITYSLAGSIPEEVIIKHKDEYEFEKKQLDSELNKSELTKLRKKHFLKLDKYLHKAEHGGHYLKNDNIAVEIKNRIRLLRTH